MPDLTLDDFDFNLPEALIALRPARPRSSARLLLAEGGQLADRRVSDLAGILRADDLLVFNDTKVIPARLRGTRQRQTPHGSGLSEVEVTLAEPLETGSWIALAKPAKRLAAGDIIRFGEVLTARVEDRQGAEVRLTFETGETTLDSQLEAVGTIPLPPYIASRRAVDAADLEDYQTMFARTAGAVAAPTASLHFDEGVMGGLAAKGIEQSFVTLHVGAGTFLPVTAERIADHRMHAEWGQISAAAAEQISAAKAAGRRIIPVGTTALRVLETAGQGGVIPPWKGKTDIFITPGYHFQMASGLMTNFHLPRSTLMMLVSALMGVEEIRRIYSHAITQGYRFFSYGDSSLLLPDD